MRLRWDDEGALWRRENEGTLRRHEGERRREDEGTLRRREEEGCVRRRRISMKEVQRREEEVEICPPHHLLFQPQCIAMVIINTRWCWEGRAHIWGEGKGESSA